MALASSLSAASPCLQGRAGGQRLSDLPEGEAVVSAFPSLPPPLRAQRGGLIAPAEATGPVAPGCQALEQAAWVLSVTLSVVEGALLSGVRQYHCNIMLLISSLFGTIL